jgi:6-phosphofructokinase
MGAYAVDLISQGISSVCVGIVQNKLTYFNIEDALKLPRHSSEDFVRLSSMIG